MFKFNHATDLLVVQRIVQEGTSSAVVCGGKPKKCPPPMDNPNGVSEESLYGVRCCSEAYFPLAHNKEECGDIWGGSRAPDNECNVSATYQQAKDWCENTLNVRLCTCAEVSNKCAKGTGCGLNAVEAWCEEE